MAHLASALTARLVARKRTEVERAVDAEHRLGVGGLRVEGDSGGRGGRRDLMELGQLELARQLEARNGGDKSGEGELLHNC